MNAVNVIGSVLHGVADGATKIAEDQEALNQTVRLVKATLDAINRNALQPVCATIHHTFTVLTNFNAARALPPKIGMLASYRQMGVLQMAGTICLAVSDLLCLLNWLEQMGAIGLQKVAQQVGGIPIFGKITECIFLPGMQSRICLVGLIANLANMVANTVQNGFELPTFFIQVGTLAMIAAVALIETSSDTLFIFASCANATASLCFLTYFLITD